MSDTHPRSTFILYPLAIIGLLSLGLTVWANLGIGGFCKYPLYEAAGFSSPNGNTTVRIKFEGCDGEVDNLEFQMLAPARSQDDSFLKLKGTIASAKVTWNSDTSATIHVVGEIEIVDGFFGSDGSIRYRDVDFRLRVDDDA